MMRRFGRIRSSPRSRPVTEFFKAEQYHQDYFKLNPAQRYCRAVIQPKLDKFQEVFRDKLRPV